MPLRPETRKKYVKQARRILEDVAKNGKTITYGELMKKMRGPGQGYIGEILEKICITERENGRPRLSAVVVCHSNRLPGEIFWKSCVLPPSIKNASMAGKIDYWEEERSRVWKLWGREYAKIKDD